MYCPPKVYYSSRAYGIHRHPEMFGWIILSRLLYSRSPWFPSRYSGRPWSHSMLPHVTLLILCYFGQEVLWSAMFVGSFDRVWRSLRFLVEWWSDFHEIWHRRSASVPNFDHELFMSKFMDQNCRAHRRRSSVNFKGRHKIFARKICIKNQQNARILHDSCPKKISIYPNFMIFARKKITKFPNFTRFLPESARILHNNCPKNIFFRILGGTCHPCPPRLLRLWPYWKSSTTCNSSAVD